jgi:hypothetical protein
MFSPFLKVSRADAGIFLLDRAPVNKFCLSAMSRLGGNFLFTWKSDTLLIDGNFVRDGAARGERAEAQ